jgi:arylsulfatase A-like enzyme
MTFQVRRRAIILHRGAQNIQGNRAMGCLLIALFATLLAGPQDSSTSAPRRRALIISVDGLRPDVMLRADAPRIRSLIDEGSFTCWAQTTAVAITLPSHVSMLTGVRPQRHQIEWNHDLPLTHAVYPAVPTLFELAHNGGYTTAMVAAKAKFSALNKPGTIDTVWLPQEDAAPDAEVVAHTLVILEEKKPELLFVHLGEVDGVGHAKGWGSPEQLIAIHHVDTAIGQILDALKAKELLDSTLVIVSSDHGGAGRSHGADDVRSRNIPWIARGPGVRHGFDLTRVGDLQVRTEDTFATACAWMSIKVPPGIDGKPVTAIFQDAARKSSEQTNDATR